MKQGSDGMDTVLVGGGGFLLAAGAIFLAIDKIGKSEMADRRKRLLTYALIAALIALTISIFHWHRAVYLAANG
ncbi:MAG: diguanylate cyclase [Candidatus Puniceispirillaceae bacterium]